MSISFNPEILEQFKRVMRARGIIAPDHLEADGEIHRVGTEGREDKYDAAYVLRYNDAVPSGGFQNWRDGLDWENWHADLGRELTDAEREALQQQSEADRARFVQEKARWQVEAVLIGTAGLREENHMHDHWRDNGQGSPSR